MFFDCTNYGILELWGAYGPLVLGPPAKYWDLVLLFFFYFFYFLDFFKNFKNLFYFWFFLLTFCWLFFYFFLKLFLNFIFIFYFTLFYFLFYFFYFFYFFVLLSPTSPWRFLYLRETQANVLRGHMLSGGPNWELQENVILYWQGLQCWEKSLHKKNLCKQQSRSRRRRSRRRRSTHNLVLGFWYHERREKHEWWT